MTAEDFRALALSLPDAAEGEHMRHPDFRVHGSIFASLSDDESVGTLKLTLEQQEKVSEVGGPFEPAAGAWGRHGWTRVRLADARKDRVRRAMRWAWENASTQEPRARRRKSR